MGVLEMVVPSHRGRSRKLRKEGGVLGGEKIIWRECNLGPYWVITQYHLKDGYLPKILKHLRNGRGGGGPSPPLNLPMGHATTYYQEGSGILKS